MTSICQVIRNSEIPIIIYVSPRGAMAASAGTIITLAGHLSAMAPETTIGAASRWVVKVKTSVKLLKAKKKKF